MKEVETETEWIRKQRQKVKSIKNASMIFFVGYFIIWTGILFIQPIAWRLICGGIWIALFALIMVMGELTNKGKRK